MVDAVSVTAIIISSMTALGGVIAGIHIKRMRSGCCESECFETTEHKEQRKRNSSSKPETMNKQPSTSSV